MIIFRNFFIRFPNFSFQPPILCYNTDNKVRTEEVVYLICPKETGVLPGSELYFNTVGALPQRLFFYVNCCGHYYCEHGYRINRRYMDCLLLILVEKGELRLEYQDQKYVARKGDIILLDGRFHQYYDTAEYVEFFWMHLSGQNIADLCEQLTRVRSSVLHRPGSRQPAALVRRLVTQFATDQPVEDAERSRLIYNIICHLLQGDHFAVTEEQISPVQNAVRFIRNHLGESLSLQRIADEVQLSPSHLIRLFHAELHHSPHEYIVLMRMDRARYLLKSTNLPIKKIAVQVGYRSESSFISAFTERVGISPLKYRKLPLG